jgi:hypothetical protein
VERRDAVAAGDEERLVPGRRRGERPAQRAQALREIAGRERGQRARAGPIAFRNRRKVPRPGSTVRIEKGRRSGGSAEVPALIITNWPARAVRATSAWRTVRTT